MPTPYPLPHPLMTQTVPHLSATGRSLLLPGRNQPSRSQLAQIEHSRHLHRPTAQCNGGRKRPVAGIMVSPPLHKNDTGRNRPVPHTSPDDTPVGANMGRQCPCTLRTPGVSQCIQQQSRHQHTRRESASTTRRSSSSCRTTTQCNRSGNHRGSFSMDQFPPCQRYRRSVWTRTKVSPSTYKTGWTTI